MNDKSGMKQVVGQLPKRGTEEPKAPPPPQDDKDEKDLKRQTLYLPLGVHDQLRAAAYTKRISMQAIIREALDMWFRDKGMALWDEAKRKGVQERKQ